MKKLQKIIFQKAEQRQKQLKSELNEIKEKIEEEVNKIADGYIDLLKEHNYNDHVAGTDAYLQNKKDELSKFIQEYDARARELQDEIMNLERITVDDRITENIDLYLDGVFNRLK